MVLGLTGGIGCGKSAALAMFARLGFKVVDADQLARSVLVRPEIVQQLVARWGREALGADGLPDRAWIGRKVFGAPAELAFLEGLVHPEVARLRQAAVAEAEVIIDAGVQSFETTSFVSPRAVPQMADAMQVMAQVQRKPGVRLTGLVPNARGAERAAAAQVDMMASFVSASETHCQANLNKSKADALADVHEFTPIAQQFHIPVRGAVATAFGCPFDGEISQQRLLDVVGSLLPHGHKHINPKHPLRSGQIVPNHTK